MEKPLTLPEKKKRINIKKVVNNSKHLFEKRGYYNTTIDELCKSAMISRSSFFNYFGSKEQIIFLIIQEDVEDYREYIDQKLAAELEPVQIIRAAYNYILSGSVKYRNITAVLYEFAMQKPEYKQLLRDYSSVEQRAILNAQQKGAIRSDIAAPLVAQMIHGCYMEVMAKSASENVEEDFNVSLTALLQLLKI